MPLWHWESGAHVMHPKLMELLFSPCQPVLKNVMYVVNPVLQTDCEDQLFEMPSSSVSAVSEKNSSGTGFTHISKAEGNSDCLMSGFTTWSPKKSIFLV